MITKYIGIKNQNVPASIFEYIDLVWSKIIEILRQVQLNCPKVIILLPN